MVPLRNLVAISPSSNGLFSIAAASSAVSFTRGVLTVFAAVRPKSFSS